MADQTQINHSNKESSFELSGSLGNDVGEVAHDLLQLTELQSQLFLTEIREFGQRSILPSMFLITGVMLGAACFPIALIALAFVLVQLTNLSMAASFLIVLAVGLFGSVVLSIVGWLQMRKRISFLPRSQEEFALNYQWIKSVFFSNRIARSTSTNSSKEPK